MCDRPAVCVSAALFEMQIRPAATVFVTTAVIGREGKGSAGSLITRLEPVHEYKYGVGSGPFRRSPTYIIYGSVTYPWESFVDAPSLYMFRTRQSFGGFFLTVKACHLFFKSSRYELLVVVNYGALMCNYGQTIT